MLDAFEEFMRTPATLDALGIYCVLPHCMFQFNFKKSLVFLKSSRVSTVQCQKNIVGLFQLVEDIDS